MLLPTQRLEQAMELDEFMACSYGRNWRQLEQQMEHKNKRLQGLQDG